MNRWRMAIELILTAVLVACTKTSDESTPSQAAPPALAEGERAVETPRADKAEQKKKSAPPPPVATAQAKEMMKRAAPRKSRSSVQIATGKRAPIRRPPRPTLPPNRERYEQILENEFHTVADAPLSTFSIDVDTASYANIRRMLTQGTYPPKAAVRIEEMINYFDYDYPVPDGEVPFSTSVEIAACPWVQGHLLAKIGLKGRPVTTTGRAPANLVFLLDVSGSMSRPNKLPLLIRSLKMAVNQLGEQDRVAIVVYAGASGLVLPSTPFTYRQRIMEALDGLRAGGSTNAGEGIELAYRTAEAHFIKGGINRVILATDGDFNVGVTNKSALKDLVVQKAKKGVFLTVLGLGMGNLKDDMLETLADKGNGNYAYIDDFQEARKVFSEQINGTLVTIAKDVKIQVEFNPAHVDSYRLIGYENRMLAAEDFNDDTKDAGEIGAGHMVTALYQLVPKGLAKSTPKVDPLKYQAKTADAVAPKHTDEMMTVKLRYKHPEANTSKKLEYPIRAIHSSFAAASPDFRFAVAIAGFGMLLRDSKYKGDLTYPKIIEMAQGARGSDPKGYRVEAVRLMSAAKDIAR